VCGKRRYWFCGTDCSAYGKTDIPFGQQGGSSLFGNRRGMFLVLCDTISRIPTAEIPVGVLTSMFGAPYFISVLIRNKKKVV